MIRVFAACSGALLTFACAALVAACSASPVSEGENAAASAEALSPLSPSEYGYFFAENRAHGYVASLANGARMTCGNGVTETCPVANVDLSSLGTSDADAATLLAMLDGRDARSVIFVGQIVQQKSSRTLKVVEAWRAPKNVAWSGTIFHISRAPIGCTRGMCEPADALRVNLWKKWTAPSVVFDFAPGDSHCRFIPETNQACSKPYEMAEAATNLPAGLLVAGYRMSDGTLLVDQYFVRIGVGSTCDDGGLSFCDPYTPCDTESGMCGGSCDVHRNCTHGRGRGVMPYIRPDVLMPWIDDVTATAPSY